MKISLLQLVEAALTDQEEFEIAVETYIPNLFKVWGLKSKSAVRRLIDQKGFYLNFKAIDSYTAVLEQDMIVKIGKKSPHRLNLPKLQLKQCDKIENRKYISMV